MAGVTMISLTILSFILSFVFYVSATEPVPVLLWQSFSGSSLSAPSSALWSQSSSEFSDFLLKKITDSKPLVVVFGEKSLSVEDFTWIATGEEHPFPKLEKVFSSAKSKLYIPDVSGPLTSLHNLKELDYHLEDVEMNEEIPTSGKRLVFVNLDSERPGESRLDMLRRHDRFISSVYNQLTAKHPGSKIIAMYTGQSPSWRNGDLSPLSIHRKRSRRDVSATDMDFTLLNGSNHIYLYSPSSSIQLKIKDQVFNLSKPTVTTGDIRKTGASSLAVTYRPGDVVIRLEFMFLQSDGMWNLTQVNASYNGGPEEELKPQGEITAPLGFSYHCSTTETFKSADASLTLLNPQIQPYTNDTRFGTAYDCVYFFTPSILSGLLLTVLLLAITAWGLSMIMDIHTMDRFDDPKGKPLFISASE